MDQIANSESEVLRRGMLKVLAYSAWQDHPHATHIRAILGMENLPTTNEFEQGAGAEEELLYAYDFTLNDTRRERLP